MRPEIKYKRKRMNLTIREDIVQDAKDLNLNASKIAEAALAAAAREEKIRRWQAENEEAIEAINERVRKHGLAFKPVWATH